MGHDNRDIEFPRWDDERFRAIDDSLGTLVRQLLLAVGGLFVAFVVAQLVAGSMFHVTRGPGALIVGGLLLAVFGSISIFLTSARPIRAAIGEQRKAIAASEVRLRLDAERHRFATQVQDALEMVDTEDQALDVVGRALAAIADNPAELLLADSSRAHLRRAAVSATGGPAGCGVESPWACPAVRRGQTMRFAASTDLAACPRLRDRDGACAAVCLPVTVLGTPMGVLHVTASPSAVPDGDVVTRLEALALQAGSRLGMLRAISSSELQAATDALTGAANRRSLEERLHHLANDDTPYALVLADLDHFKDLNDTYGHAVGDRALRLFVDVLRTSVRERDMIVRYGGEEFIVLLHGLRRERSLEVVDRIRLGLTHALDGHEVPRFSASFGIADSTQADTPERVIRLADLAMFEAKNTGRDRVVVCREHAEQAPAAAAPAREHPATARTRDEDPAAPR